MVYTVGGIKMGDYVIDFPKQKKSAETSKKAKGNRIKRLGLGKDFQLKKKIGTVFGVATKNFKGTYRVI